MKNEKNKNKKQIDAEINRALLNDFDKIENFVVTRWKQMLIGAGVIIVLVAVAYGIVVKKENNVRAALIAIGNANDKEELCEAVERFKDYPEVNGARLKLANIYLDEKDYGKAKELFDQIALRVEDSVTKSRALLDSAYCDEKAGNFEAASKSFLIIGDNNTYISSVRAEAYYAAARMLIKQNKKEEACAAFDKLFAIPADQASGIWISLGKTLQAQVR